MAVSTRNDSARSVPAVERAIRLLKALGTGPAGQRLSDLSRELGLNKSTVHQILQVLEAHGLVERNVDSLRYRLGYGLVQLASPVLGRLDLRAVARPSLRQLAAETGQTVFLGVRDGDRIVIVDKEESPADLKITAPVGRRIPLTAGSFGKVFLAYADPTDADRLLRHRLRRFTRRTVVDPHQYRLMLDQTRLRGYALDDEEYLDGVRGVSAPVFGPAGELAAALAVVGFTSSLTEDRTREVVEATRLAGEGISLRLGGTAFGPNPLREGDGALQAAGPASPASRDGQDRRSTSPLPVGEGLG